MERVRRYVEAGRSRSYGSETKDVGSPSQYLFDTDFEKDDDDEEENRYSGTCNGYLSHPGSKSNLLLCRECDLRSRHCGKPPPDDGALFVGSYAEEGADHRADQERRMRSSSVSGLQCEPADTRKECSGSHILISSSTDRDLICFNCQSTKLCPQCEYCSSKVFEKIGTSLDSEEPKEWSAQSWSEENEDANVKINSTKYPINAVVKIQVNSQVMDMVSDKISAKARIVEDKDRDTMIVDCLVALDEVKGNVDENEANDSARKLNGTPQTRYLNYMIVLFL